jgi:hypothetical protein
MSTYRFFRRVVIRGPAKSRLHRYPRPMMGRLCIPVIFVVNLAFTRSHWLHAAAPFWTASCSMAHQYVFCRRCTVCRSLHWPVWPWVFATRGSCCAGAGTIFSFPVASLRSNTPSANGYARHRRRTRSFSFSVTLFPRGSPCKTCRDFSTSHTSVSALALSPP